MPTDPFQSHGSADAAAQAVLVTGADGFVGSALCPELAAAGYSVRRAVRAHAAEPDDDGSLHYTMGDIGPDTDWARAVAGTHAVVHLAARTHVMRERAADPIAEYRRVNVDATRRLAEQAVAAGVRRLVFLSSIKVNGEATHGRPYTEEDPPRPEDAYGTTKLEAEQVLQRLGEKSGLETVVLRPPLVYGPGVKGNFLRLLATVARGLPLPLASLDNRRSLLYVGNLVDAILAALRAPQAAGRTYLVSDGEDHSTPELVRAIAAALGVSARLFACPEVALRVCAMALGRRREFDRLAGSLQIDDSRIRRELSWRPRYSLGLSLAETAQWYHSQSGAQAPCRV